MFRPLLLWPSSGWKIYQRRYIDMIQHKTIISIIVSKGPNTNNCSVLYLIYIASLINYIQPDDGHSNNGRNI